MVERREKRFCAFIIVFLFSAMAGLSAFAIMVEYDLDRLVGESTDIVTGKVTGKISHYTKDKSTIVTDVTFEPGVNASFLGDIIVAYDVTLAPAFTIGSGSELMFGFRPNDVVPVGDDASATDFSARVHLTEPLGDVVILDLEAGGAALKMVLPEEQAVQYAVGDVVPVRLRVENTHVFARETGTAIR